MEFEELSEKLENHLIQSKASWLRTHSPLFIMRFLNIANLKIWEIFMNEKEIWDYVIKWGTAQNLTLPEKMEEWSDENIMTLKKFVIFQMLALKELPAKVIELFSTIINEEHVSLISPSWINYQQTSYSLTNNPYVFQLLLRGSKDGFAPRTFWDICDRNNIVIAKVEGTNEIIGGFNPLAWNKTKEGWVKTNKSFIFSFKDGNIQNPILSEVKNETYALRYPYYNKDDYGPTFGEYEFMMRSDVSYFTQDKKNRCYSYDRFSIIDYEVFKVVKKSF
ncbi:hypothetical protein Glove_228g122 [Diversispora epigaea]|uniref:TLDc domain-containing protein n=1 Tax=Diversispora epigaea TaxID=1348612 RepID=A0A397IL34_9GLOM|nr:hypothetical protein Glove_228g122 [Diversispora epigaea]